MVGEGDEEVEEEEEEEEVDTDHLVDLRSVVRAQWSCWCHRLVVTSDPSLRRVKPAVSVKEEPSSPGLAGGGVLPVDTPLSPTTFINSILQEETTPTLSSTSAGAPPTTGHNKYHSACMRACCVVLCLVHAHTCMYLLSHCLSHILCIAAAGSPLVVMSSAGPLPPPAASQSPAGSSSGGGLLGRKCQTVACLDR